MSETWIVCHCPQPGQCASNLAAAHMLFADQEAAQRYADRLNGPARAEWKAVRIPDRETPGEST